MGEQVIDFLSLAPLALILIGLTAAVLLDSYTRRDRRRIMLLILLAVFLHVAENYLDYRLSLDDTVLQFRTVNSIVGYSLRPLIIVLFFYLLKPDRKYWIGWTLAALNAAVYMTALFSDVCFSFFADGFHRGPLGLTCYYVSGALFAYLIYLTIREYRRIQKRDLLLPLLSDLFIAVAVVFDFSLGPIPMPVSALTVALVSSCVINYIWLHLQYVRAHERQLIDGQQFQIMLSQIQPHFLYNSLTAIRDTYRSDTARGERAITEFADYLRHNMDSLTEEAPIPFAKELDHVRCYLDLQKLRFGDELRVVYDLESTDFLLPTLTLQPLVENAVSHGVRKSESGRGTVTIRSREFPDCRELSVTDDGPGFDPERLRDDSDRSHIGLRNVRERLQRTSVGELRIDSAPGKGTTVTIILPIAEEGTEC